MLSANTRSSSSDISHSFHLVAGTSDGREGGGACHHYGDTPAANKAPLAEIPPRVGHAPEGGNGPSLRLPVAQCWDHLKRVTRWLDDSWVGDLIGAACLFGILYLSLLIGWVLS